MLVASFGVSHELFIAWEQPHFGSSKRVAGTILHKAGGQRFVCLCRGKTEFACKGRYGDAKSTMDITCHGFSIPMRMSCKGLTTIHSSQESEVCICKVLSMDTTCTSDEVLRFICQCFRFVWWSELELKSSCRQSGESSRG